MSDWTEKYRPETVDDIQGNNTACRELSDWAQTWDNHRSAAILHGPPGIGKTTAAHAVANDMGWDVMEMNASDKRTGDIVDRIAGEASKTRSLTQTGDSKGRRLVIVDEADNFDRNADRGGSQAITEVVKETEQPIVLIANDFYDMSNTLRNACKTIEFEEVDSGLIKGTLASICGAENIEYEEDALDALASSQGDVRSAINDLQAVAQSGGTLTEDDVITDTRDKEEDLFDFLDNLLQSAEPEEARSMAMDVDETPDNLIMWIEHNLTREYDDEELTGGYRSLSNADKWLGRVRATQTYAYWKYANDQMTAGVAKARTGRHDGWTRYQPPYQSYYGNTSDTRDVAKKIAAVEDISITTAEHEVVPILGAMVAYCKPSDLTAQIAARYDLDAGDVADLTGSGKSTNKVQNIISDAEELRGQPEQSKDSTEATDTTDEPDTSTTDAETSTDSDDGDDADDDDDEEDTTQQTGLGDFA